MKPGRNAIWLDVVWLAALAVMLGAAAIWLQHLADFAIPRRNVYFNADTDRVFANLIDRNSNYIRLNVHPLFGIVCIAFQNLFGAQADLRVELAVWSGLHGVLFAVFSWLAIRVWGGSRATAAGGTLLAASSASFVYWAPIAETHLMGGITVLALAALWRWRPADVALAALRSAVMFALGASVVVTNVAAWGLAQLRLAGAWGGRPRQLIADNLAAAGPVAVAGLAGFGLLAFGTVVQDMVLRNPSVPPLFRLWYEARYISVERGSPIDLLHVIGLVHDAKGLLWLLNLPLVAALVWALVRNGPERAFLALWPIFGLALHCVYDRAHGFLFSPNYLPLGVAAVAIAAGSASSRFGPPALVAAALVCAPVNYLGYVEKRAEIAAQTDPPEWYGHLRARHDVPASDIVRLADPPIGFDQ